MLKFVNFGIIKRMIKIICSKCGSEDLLFDAYAYWDVNEQEFKLANTFPEGDVYCNGCDKHDISTREIKISDNSG